MHAFLGSANDTFALLLPLVDPCAQDATGSTLLHLVLELLHGSQARAFE
jgi:hypothetical protein